MCPGFRGVSLLDRGPSVHSYRFVMMYLELTLARHVTQQVRRWLAGVLVAASLLLAGCSSGGAGIVVHVEDVVGVVDDRLLGTNLPAWLLPEILADETFRGVTTASGTSMLRLPGGSWSNSYDWLGCEREDPETCSATWASNPSDFIDFINATGIPAMWTVAINGTAEEAAAVVAFFNGEVADDRPIGTDRLGRDWKTVGHWAQLRADNGSLQPTPIRYWEVGNEVYGAIASAGPDCAPWGWEDVWTCDGTEYVEGNAQHDGFRAFRNAMVFVDPTIDIGIVGVGARGEWGDWDDEVMAAAGDTIDFYVVHHYGSNGDVAAEDVLGIPRRVWPDLVEDLRDGFAEHGLGDIPIAVTEHNLVAFLDGDDEVLMPTVLNAFYLADTIGQLAANGVSIANQWNMANGRALNGSDYGLIDGQTHARSPAYFSLVLWSRFGDELVDVTVEPDDLMVYGGRSDDTVSLLVINPTEAAVTTTVVVESRSGVESVTVDTVVADALLATSVTYNGVASPSNSLDEPSEERPSTDGNLAAEFPPYSMTLLRWTGKV